MSYKQKPIEQREPELSPRLKHKKQAYDDAHIEYILTGDDYHEIEFYDALKRSGKKPRVYIPTIYRLQVNKDFVVDKTSNEVIVYWKKQEIEQYNGQILPDDRLHGIYEKPITQPKRDANGNTVRWDKIREEPIFQIPFSPETVDKLIEESDTLVQYFYVGIASTISGSGRVTEDDPFRIHNLEDFKYGTLQELMDMGAYNYSTKEPALKSWREKGSDIKEQNRNLQATTQRVRRIG